MMKTSRIHPQQYPVGHIAFSDYCKDRIFLRRVGDGYIFIHRMLMEHFAELATENGQV